MVYKLHGPYTRKDGRQIVIHYWGPNNKRTQSYPRYLMEQHLGRRLEDWEQVDHINDDPTDNRIENFQLLTVQQNNRKSIPLARTLQFICPICDKEFYLLERVYRRNQLVLGKSGPYCSKSCAGKIGQDKITDPNRS